MHMKKKRINSSVSQKLLLFFLFYSSALPTPLYALTIERNMSNQDWGTLPSEIIEPISTIVVDQGSVNFSIECKSLDILELMIEVDFEKTKYVLQPTAST